MDVDTRRAHERITGLEDVLYKHLDEHRKFTESMTENTKLTEEIAASTKEIVAFFKGAKGLRAFLLWASPVVLIVLGVWEWIKLQARS